MQSQAFFFEGLYFQENFIWKTSNTKFCRAKSSFFFEGLYFQENFIWKTSNTKFCRTKLSFFFWGTLFSRKLYLKNFKYKVLPYKVNLCTALLGYEDKKCFVGHMWSKTICRPIIANGLKYLESLNDSLYLKIWCDSNYEMYISIKPPLSCIVSSSNILWRVYLQNTTINREEVVSFSFISKIISELKIKPNLNKY